MVVFTTQKSFVIVRENLARESSKLKEISASKVIRDPYPIVLHLVLVRQPKFRLLYIPLFKVYVHSLVMNHIHTLLRYKLQKPSFPPYHSIAILNVETSIETIIM